MMDYTLEEDIPDEFKGGTLQINTEETKAVEKQKQEQNNEKNREAETETGNGWKSSFILPITQKLTDTLKIKKNDKPEITTIQPVTPVTLETATNFFTFREGIVENAVKHCVEDILREFDGQLVAKYLLTEINLWDSDKERLILLTENCCISVKYDFIALKRLEYRRISLRDLDCIIVGDLVYPAGSLVPRLNGLADGVTGILQTCLFHGWSKNDDKVYESFQTRERNMKGVRLMWNKGKPLAFSEKWNPFNSDVPFCTLTAHPLYHNEECNEHQRKLYDTEDFVEKLKEQITTLQKETECMIHHKNILLQNYVGLGSLIHNRNALGYFKVRGKFSF